MKIYSLIDRSFFTVMSLLNYRSIKPKTNISILFCYKKTINTLPYIAFLFKIDNLHEKGSFYLLCGQICLKLF